MKLVYLLINLWMSPLSSLFLTLRSFLVSWSRSRFSISATKAKRLSKATWLNWVTWPMVVFPPTSQSRLASRNGDTLLTRKWCHYDVTTVAITLLVKHKDKKPTMPFSPSSGPFHQLSLVFLTLVSLASSSVSARAMDFAKLSTFGSCV